MQPKPELYSSHYAEWFKDSDVIAAYPSRPPYARVAIEFLSELVTDRPRRVLDIGCGTGDIARDLGPLVHRVNAVDFSAGDDRRRPTDLWAARWTNTPRTTASCGELSGSTGVSAIEPAGAAAGVIEIAPRYGHR